jgi:hypothetical protein
MMASSSHRSRAFGTGTSVADRQRIALYSRSTWCALGSSGPGGFLRIT